MKKTLPLLILLLFLVSEMAGQTAKMDSLAVLYEQEKNKLEENDSRKKNLLVRLYYASWAIDAEKSIEYMNEIIKIAEKRDNKSLKLDMMYGIATQHYNLGLHEQTIRETEEMIAYKEKHNINSATALSYARLYTRLASAYYASYKYPKALSYFNKALDLAQEKKDTLLLSELTLSLGHFYNESEEKDKALAFYLESYAYEKKMNRPEIKAIQIAVREYRIGNIYLDKAREAQGSLRKIYLEKALDYYLRSGLETGKKYPTVLHDLYEALSYVRELQENLPAALEYAQKMKELAFLDTNNSFTSKCLTIVRLAELLKKSGQKEEALLKTDTALMFLEEEEAFKYSDLSLGLYTIRFDIYSEKEYHQKALETLLEMNEIKDTMNRQELKKEVADIEAKYELGVLCTLRKKALVHKQYIYKLGFSFRLIPIFQYPSTNHQGQSS